MIVTAPSRRAAALLFVLAFVVAVVPLVTLAATRVSIAAQRHTSHHDAALANDLMDASMLPILDWLRRESARVVLPPEATQPRVTLLDDTILIDQTPVRVRLTAWDLRGMLPIDVARTGSPMSLTLPEDARQRIDGLPDHPSGLDAIPPVSRGRLVFPTPDSADPALGALVHAGRRTSRQPVARLSVNTTPIPLLTQAMRLAGRGGLDQLIQKRTSGERSGVPQLGDTEPERGRRVELTSSSNAWGVRVDITSGATRRSWWTQWTRISGDWMLQRRTPILWEPHPRDTP